MQVRQVSAGFSETRPDEFIKGAEPPRGMVLLDGPPILEFIDSEVLAPLCDAALFVVAAGVTPASAVEEAMSRIRATHVPVAGVILNQVLPAYL